MDKLRSYPKEAPYFVDSMLGEKYDGNFVIKTPLWAIQHCLSMNNPSKKRDMLSNSLVQRNYQQQQMVLSSFVDT